MAPSVHSVSRQSVLSQCHLVLYRQALHPELFALKARLNLDNPKYNVEAWIMPGSHLLRFRFRGFSCCELLVHQHENLPTEGAVTTFPCAGEHEFEHAFTPEGVTYSTSVQTETLNEHLYRNTFEEIFDLGQQTKALIHEWQDSDGGRCLSVLDIQPLNKETHAQSYHLHARGGVVLRSQTIFQHA